MSKNNEQTDIGSELAAFEGAGVPALPDYLKHGGTPVGVESKGESVITPRIKVIEAQTEDRDALEQYGPGAAIIGDTLLAKRGDAFVAVPIFWFPSWEVWADRNDKSRDTNNPVEDMSIDPDSDIARFAKMRRSETYGPKSQFTRTWIESLNFILEVEGYGMAIASWAKGRMKVGRRLREYTKRTGADLFAHRISFTVDPDRNEKGNWFVLTGAPAKPAFVSEAEYARLRDVYDEVAASYQTMAQPPAATASSDDDTTGE